MRFDPYNLNNPEVLGRLHFWWFFVAENPVSSFEEAQFIANEGLGYLQHGINMRPTWLGAWASML